MRELICTNTSLCVGCNCCTKVCPVETANITCADENGNIIVKIDPTKCIACGTCIHICQHKAREYVDDTERFLIDLRKGISISLLVAPAVRTNIQEAGRLLTWLRELGVHKIYDVSLGADICVWGHIRYIEKYKPGSLITQPCPAIVSYCSMYQPGLLAKLSPIHSPMLCSAVYVREYEGSTDALAALSPCIAKTHEFESTNLITYNVTFKKLLDYIRMNDIILPAEESDFDHYPCGLGSIFPMPGGLKENIEFFLGKSLRIDKSEGAAVYSALDTYAKQSVENLPDIFDVLNCGDGCNLGTGCYHERNIFEINSSMDTARKGAFNGRDKAYFDALYEGYDQIFRLESFMRRYIPQPVRVKRISEEDIIKGFNRLGKHTELDQTFNCGSCGSETCHGMARKIALGVNIPENCIQKVRNDIKAEHASLLGVQYKNLQDMGLILHDIETIKAHVEMFVSNIDMVNHSIADYNVMTKTIEKIAMHVHIISLNASVEAARAGSYGKTFAVVAEEIRRLADTSKRTVSRSDEVSAQAGLSVNEMNRLTMLIRNSIEKSYENILCISQATNMAVCK